MGCVGGGGGCSWKLHRVEPRPARSPPGTGVDPRRTARASLPPTLHVPTGWPRRSFLLCARPPAGPAARKGRAGARTQRRSTRRRTRVAPSSAWKPGVVSRVLERRSVRADVDVVAAVAAVAARGFAGVPGACQGGSWSGGAWGVGVREAASVGVDVASVVVAVAGAQAWSTWGLGWPRRQWRRWRWRTAATAATAPRRAVSRPCWRAGAVCCGRSTPPGPSGLRVPCSAGEPSPRLPRASSLGRGSSRTLSSPGAARERLRAPVHARGRPRA